MGQHKLFVNSGRGREGYRCSVKFVVFHFKSKYAYNGLQVLVLIYENCKGHCGIVS